MVRRAIDEIWNLGKSDLADVLFAPDYVNHGGIIPDLVHGPEAIKISLVLCRLAFPDFFVSVENLSAYGDMVEFRWTASSAPPAVLTGISPAEKPGALTGFTRGRLAGGKIAESWTEWDHLGAFDQLGIVVPTEAGEDRHATRG
jgi:predicted ester cyclase